MKTDGTATVQYFDGNSYVGSRRMYCCGAFDASGSFSALWPHTAYFCPVCGDLWGRAVMCYEFDYAPKIPDACWVIEKRRCVKHGDGQFLSGGPEHVEAADRALLTRELLALIEGVSNDRYRNFPS